LVTTGHSDAGTGENVAKERRGVVPLERQIAEFISDIRRGSSIRHNEEQRFEPVEVEDVGPEETLSGVHPLPVGIGAISGGDSGTACNCIECGCLYKGRTFGRYCYEC